MTEVYAAERNKIKANLYLRYTIKYPQEKTSEYWADCARTIEPEYRRIIMYLREEKPKSGVEEVITALQSKENLKRTLKEIVDELFLKQES